MSRSTEAVVEARGGTIIYLWDILYYLFIFVNLSQICTYEQTKNLQIKKKTHYQSDEITFPTKITHIHTNPSSAAMICNVYLAVPQELVIIDFLFVTVAHFHRAHPCNQPNTNVRDFRWICHVQLVQPLWQTVAWHHTAPAPPLGSIVPALKEERVRVRRELSRQ